MPTISPEELEGIADTHPELYKIMSSLIDQLNQVMPSILSGTDHPEFGGSGAVSSPNKPSQGVSAAPGTLYIQRNALSAGIVLHVKDVGNTNTGWAELGAWGAVPPSSASGFQVVANSNKVTFYYDGTNGSKIVTVYRANGEQIQVPGGSTAVTGLQPNTTYFFYPYYDERTRSLQFVQGAAYGNAVGNIPIAYTVDSPNAAQQMRLAHRIPLTPGTSIPVTTPNSGSSPSTVGGGFGGNGRTA